MNELTAFRRIIIEEAIRLMALEVVIGLPPVGIADALGVKVPMLYVIAGISLSVPLVLCVLMIVIRTKRKEEPTWGRMQWQMNKRTWIIGALAVIVTILLALFYRTKGLITERDVVASILSVLFCIGLVAWMTLRRNRQ